MTAQIQKHKPSKDFDKLLSSLGPDFGKLQDKVNACFDKGRNEGFSDMEIGSMIRTELKKHYSDRTIRNVLPDTAKHQEKVRFAEKSAANERPPLEAPNAKIMESIDKGDVVNYEDAEDNELVVALALEVDRTITDSSPKANPAPQQQKPDRPFNRPFNSQPQSKEVQGIHNIDPREYDLDHLYEYDKDLLARIVVYIDKDLEDMSKLVVRRSDEVEELRKQVESVKPFVELFSTIPSEARDSWLQFMKNALEREKKLSKGGPKP